MGGEAEIAIVLTQEQAVFRAAGEHAVGLDDALGHEVVHHYAKIRFRAAQHHGRAAEDFQRGIRSGDQSLAGGFLVAGGAIDLPGKIESGDAFGFAGGEELGGGAEIVFHRVAGADHLGIFQTWHGAQEGVLDLVGEGGGNAIDVNFMGVAALWLQEKLMAILLCKADHLVLDGGTIARPNALDLAGIHRGFVEILPDDVVRGGVGVGDPAGDLFHVERGIAPGIEGEEVVRPLGQGVGEVAELGGGGIAVLDFTLGEVDGPTVEAAGGAGLETLDFESVVPEGIAQRGNSIAHPPTGLILHANMEEAAHERSAANDHGGGAEFQSEVGAHARDGIVADQQLGDISLVKMQIWRAFEDPFQAKLVGFLVRLGAGGTDAGAFGDVEHPELDGRGVGV